MSDSPSSSARPGDSSPQAAPRRPLRRDSRRMRERILDSCERIFAERGIGAPPIAIIRDLEIGNGTFYRHFPDNDALMTALYERLVARLGEVFQEVSEVESGWEALVRLFDGATAVLIARPFSAAVMKRVRSLKPDEDPAAVMREPVAEILHRAQAEGRVRPDLSGTDLAALPFMLAGWIAQFSHEERAVQLPRLRALLLAGITNHDDETLPGSALNADAFRDVVHGVGSPTAGE